MSAFLQNWCAKALESGIVQMMSLAKTLSGHALGILNYFHFPISSGKLEGINNKVGCLKRAAYGYAALTAASTAAGVATNAMNSVDTNRASATQEATPSVFQVQVIGYGMYDDSTTDAKRQSNNMVGPATATAEVIFAKQNP